MSRRLLLVPLVALVAAAPVPVVTAAAWRQASTVGVPVRVASADCSATGLWTARASAALLAGSVRGVPLGADAAAVLDTGVRSDAATIARDPAATGTAGLAFAAGGPWRLSARTTGTGSAAASVGGTGSTATVDVSALLALPPAIAPPPGLSGIALDVGPVAADATLDGCGAAWGGAAPLGRTSSVRSLVLHCTDGAVQDALARIGRLGADAATSTTDAAAAAVPAVAAAGSADLVAALVRVLGAAAAGTATATATVVPQAGALGALAAPPAGRWSSGSVAVDLGTGELLADLAPAAGTDVDVLTTARTGAAAADAGAVLGDAARSVSDAAGVARDTTAIGVRASVGVLVGGLRVATLSLAADGSADAWARGSVQPTLTLDPATAAGLPAGLVASVTSALGSMSGTRSAVASAFAAKAGAPGPAALAAASSATTALGQDLAALPASVQVTAAQQATDAGSSWTGSAEAGASSRTALRIRVRDGAGARADLFLGDVAVGPVEPALR